MTEIGDRKNKEEATLKGLMMRLSQFFRKNTLIVTISGLILLILLGLFLHYVSDRDAPRSSLSKRESKPARIGGGKKSINIAEFSLLLQKIKSLKSDIDQLSDKSISKKTKEEVSEIERQIRDLEKQNRLLFVPSIYEAGSQDHALSKLLMRFKSLVHFIVKNQKSAEGGESFLGIARKELQQIVAKLDKKVAAFEPASSK